MLSAKVEEAVGYFNGTDVLMNNAGYAEAGLAEEMMYLGILKSLCHYGAETMHKLPLMEDVLTPALVLYQSYTTRSLERWLDQINTNLSAPLI